MPGPGEEARPVSRWDKNRAGDGHVHCSEQRGSMLAEEQVSRKEPGTGFVRWILFIYHLSCPTIA